MARTICHRIGVRGVRVPHQEFKLLEELVQPRGRIGEDRQRAARFGEEADASRVQLGMCPQLLDDGLGMDHRLGGIGRREGLLRERPHLLPESAI